MLAHAERNGWNGAINAARTILPVEYSQRIRSLYKSPEDDPSGSIASTNGLESTAAQSLVPREGQKP